jgi:hypothetical protein
MRPIATKLLVLGQVSGGGGFVGAYDAIPNIAAAYGMRRLLSSYTGNLVLMVRNDDDAELAFGYAEEGDLDDAAIATWLGASNGLLKTIYDQKGSVNLTQSTKANMPLYVPNAKNGHAIIRGDGSNDSLVITRNASAAMSILIVAAKRSAPSAANRDLWSLGALARLFTNSNNSTAWNWYENSAGGVQVMSGTPAGWQVLSTIFASLSSVTSYVNGGSSTAMRLFTDIAGTSASDSDIAELVIANAAWDTTAREAAEAAAIGYWGLL